MSSRPPPIPEPPSQIPTPISYRSVPAGKSGPSFSWGMFAWSGAIIVIWLAIVRLIIPRLRDVFADFKLELPVMTKALFAVARIAADPIWMILMLSIPIAIGFATGPLSPGGRRAFRIAATLVLGGFIALMVVALFGPLVSLMEGLTRVR